MGFEEKRKRLIDKLKKKGYVESEEVERAMLEVPRENFVPDNIRDKAYIDSPQPIGSGQTISAPHMVAMMVEKLDLEKGQKVLEIGGGRGYHAAVIAELVGEKGKVFSIEIMENLAERAREALKEAGYEGVEIIEGDGSFGYKKNAPYDRISVACGSPEIPQPLLSQLKLDGMILIPVGNNFYQTLICAEKVEKGKIRKEDLGGVRFVPLRGEYGFS